MSNKQATGELHPDANLVRCWGAHTENTGCNSARYLGQVRDLENKLEKTGKILAFYQRKYFDAVEIIAQYMAVGHTCDTTDEDRPLMCDCEEPTECLIHGRIGVDGKCPRC